VKKLVELPCLKDEEIHQKKEFFFSFSGQEWSSMEYRGLLLPTGLKSYLLLNLQTRFAEDRRLMLEVAT